MLGFNYLCQNSTHCWVANFHGPYILRIEGAGCQSRAESLKDTWSSYFWVNVVT